MRRRPRVVALFAPVIVAAITTAIALPRSAGPPPHSANVLFPETARCGTYLSGAEASGYQTSRTTYSHSQPSPLDATDGFGSAGNAIDLHWLHDRDPDQTSPIVFDMGTRVRVLDAFPSIDHGPVPDEALEFTVYGSNAAAAAFPGGWTVAKIAKIFDNGWNSGWIADDFVSRWRFKVGHRYIAVGWGGPQAARSDGDAEIDAVCTPKPHKPELEELLPFLQNPQLVQVDTGALLDAIRAEEEVAIPCAAPGGSVTMVETLLTERDLRAPDSDLPFLNTYEIPMEEVEASGTAGVFSITEDDFRSWVTDPNLGMCFAEPAGPLLRLNDVPENQVTRILADANTVVYNVTDAFPGPTDRSTVLIPPEEPGANFGILKHRTGDGGDTAAFGVLFMGYVADINFQNAIGAAYGVTGGARDTKVRELLGWWNQLFYDTLHWYEPATARGGHNRYNIIPVIGSIDLCAVADSDGFAGNCPHMVQHVNVGVSMFGGAGGGLGWLGRLACGHPGSVVNGMALICSGDFNHAGIYYGSGVTDAMMFSVMGEEVGHVFGCEPSGAPGESGNHTSATVTFDGVTGPSFMTGFWDPTFRPLYTDTCDQAIAGIVNSNIPPPTTGVH